MAQKKFLWLAIVALALVVLALTLTTYGTVNESKNIISSGSIATSAVSVTSDAARSGIGV